MAIGKGSNKQLRLKRQDGKGTIATAATGGQIVRRNTSTFNLVKDKTTNESEQNSRKQLMSSRAGARTVNGSLSGIFSPGTYADPLSALLMRDFTAIPSIVGVSLTISGAGPSFQIARDAGDWLADGAKIGRVIRASVGALNAANINKNLLIIGVSALNLQVVPLNRRLPLVAEGPIAGCTVAFPGKITWVPEAGHTEIYFTAEEWYPDVPYSQVSTDVKAVTAAIRIPGTGNCGIDFSFLGLDQVTDDAVYFEDPAPETTTQSLTASAGALFVNGIRQAVITDISATIDGRGAVAEPVVGDDVRPDVYTGKVMFSGTFTAYFDGPVLPDLFIDETATAMVFGMSSGTAANADFVTMTASQVKVDSADPDDVETGLKRTYKFTGEFNAAGGAAQATNATTIEIQDSAAA